jgi:hypothetical protein
VKRSAWWAAIAACTLLGARPALGQRPGAESTDWREVVRSPVTLEREHWAVRAAWKAEAMGLAPGFLPARTQVPRDLVWAALQEAVSRAAPRGAATERLVRGWVDRFVEEFPEYGSPRAAAGRPVLLGSRVEGELVAARGRAAPGEAEFPPDRTGAEPLPDRNRPAARADVAAGLGSAFAAHLQLQAETDSTAVRQLAVSARWRSLSLTAGRDPVGYATGIGGGVVLTGGVPIDGVQLESWRPVTGPGWLRYLGPVSFDGFVGRIPGDRHPGDPYFWGARVSVQPHPRTTLSIQRAALFGGAGAEKPVTFHNVLRMLIGNVSGGTFEDQVVSVAGRYRLPTERVFPLTLYAEAGAEDASGAWGDVVGAMAGLESAALPGAPWLSLGAEVSYFQHSCCGNPPWYRHSAFRGSWAWEDQPLGHRLGGQGSEGVVYGSADLLDERLRIRGEAFGRGRSGENLYVPGRTAGSLGGGGEVTWRFTPRAELEAEARGENGRGWSESSLRVSARWMF